MPRLLLPLLFVVLCPITQRATADIVVQPWEVFCLVSSSTTQRSVTFIRDENPFQDSHTAVLGNSFSSATYDFAWTGDDAHFDVTIGHHLEQLQGTTSSSGLIYLRPTVDSFVTFSGTWEYAWPSSTLASTTFSMLVADLDADEGVAYDIAHGGNVGIGPPVGTLNLSDGGLMQAGSLHLIRYTVQIISDPSPPGTFGTGAGQLNFTITPVPEPATLTMLVLSMLLMPRKRIR